MALESEIDEKEQSMKFGDDKEIMETLSSPISKLTSDLIQLSESFSFDITDFISNFTNISLNQLQKIVAGDLSRIRESVTILKNLEALKDSANIGIFKLNSSNFKKHLLVTKRNAEERALEKRKFGFMDLMHKLEENCLAVVAATATPSTFDLSKTIGNMVRLGFCSGNLPTSR